MLVEYRGLWAHDALAGSGLSDQVKAHLREQAASRPRTKLLLVRRTPRRGHAAIAVHWGSSPERGGVLYRADVEAYEDLLELDLTAPGEPLGHPLILVCTHGKHDRCCARYGRPLLRALDEQAEGEWVWQSSHVGGDRFAGNAVFLPEGLYFGRVTPEEAWPVLDEYLAGRIHLARYRGRACYPFAVQAAERAVREASGLRGIDDLELAGVALSDRQRDAEAQTVGEAGVAAGGGEADAAAGTRDGNVVSFRAGGRLYEVEVTAAPGPLTYLTCSADVLRRPRRYAAGILRESAA